MSKLINFEVVEFPAVRLIGKQVSMSMKLEVDNPAVCLWQSMWKDGSMEFLRNLPERYSKDPESVGWMGEYDPKNNTFTYIAGVLVKKGTAVPKEYVYRDLVECYMGIGWIQGVEEGADLHARAREHMALAMKENGYEYDSSAGGYEMQYYSYNRFGVPHYLGEKMLVMDYYTPCKKIKTEDKEAERNIDKTDEYKIGSRFNSLAQRLIYAYKCTFPDCIPVKNENVSESSQRQMHRFLKDVICSIYKNPSLINLQAEKDDYFEFWMLCKNKPELNAAMSKDEKTLLDFYSFLYKLGEIGEVKDNKLYVNRDRMKPAKKKLIQLEQFALLNDIDETSVVFYSEKYPEIFPAWKFLCNIKQSSPKGEIVRFIYCMYDISMYNAGHFFGNITESSSLIKNLEDYFKSKDYKCSFDEYGIHWKKEYSDKQIGKVDFSFAWKRRDQITYSFRVPSFRLMLSHYDKMDDELKYLTYSRTKKCDGCGYCTQMNKSSKRNPLTISIEYNGKKIGKCPLFPNLTWRYIDHREVKGIKQLFDYAENVLYQGK